MIAASATLMAVLYQPGHDPSRVYYGTDTRAQSLLIGAVVGIAAVQARADPHAAAGASRVRVAAFIGAGYTLWLFWRMSERTDASVPGRVPARGVGGVRGDRVGGPARPRRARSRRSRSRRCAGSGGSPTASTSGTGRSTSRSRRPAPGSTALRCCSLRLAVSFAFATAVVLRGREADPPGHVPAAEAADRCGRRRCRARWWSRSSPPPPAAVSRSPRSPTRALEQVTASAHSARRTGRSPPYGHHRPEPAPAPPARARRSRRRPPKVMIVGDSVAGTLGLGFQTVGRDDQPVGLEPRPARVRPVLSAVRSSRVASCTPVDPELRLAPAVAGRARPVQARRRGDAGGRVGHPRPRRSTDTR